MPKRNRDDEPDGRCRCCFEVMTDRRFTTRTHFVLEPCGCVICPFCFGEMHAKKNLRLPKCPGKGCGQPAKRHLCNRVIGRQGRGDSALRSVEEPVRSGPYLNVPYDNDLDHLDEYLALHPKDQKEDLVIAVFWGGDNEQVDGWSCTVNRDSARMGCLPASTKNAIGRQLPSFLHSILCRPERQDLDPASYAELEEEGDVQGFAKADTSVLKMFQFYLIRGFRDGTDFDYDEQRPPSVAVQRIHNTSHVISEMVRAGVSGSARPFQKTFSRIIKNGSKTAIDRFATNFGMAVSGNQKSNDDDKKAFEKMYEGLKRSPGDQLELNLDNFDQKYAGKDGPGCAHFVTKQISVYGKDLTDKYMHLSRVRNIWHDVLVRQKITPDMLLSGDKEYSDLHIFKGKLIRILLESWDKIPYFEEIIAMAKEGRLKGMGEVKIGGYGHQRIIEKTGGTGASSVTARRAVMNQYGLNMATTDAASAANFNNASVVEETVLKYPAHMWLNYPGKKPLNEYDSDDPDAPAMANGMVHVVVDGNPYVQAKNIQAKNPNKYPMVKLHCGGFHYNMNLGRRTNHLLGRLGKDDYVSVWRPTPGQLSWYNGGSDPTDHDAENWGATMGYLFMQTVGYVRERGGDIDLDRDGCMSISPSAIQDYVMERCKKHPELLIDEFILNTMVINLMMQCAENAGEGKGDANMFHSAAALSEHVFSVSNATFYMQVREEKAKDKFTMSEFDNAITDDRILTKKTINGASVYTDRNMEYQQKDTSVGNGSKLTGCGRRDEQYMNRMQLNLQEIVNDRNIVKNMQKKHSRSREGKATMHSIPRSERPLHLGAPFVDMAWSLHEGNRYGTKYDDDDAPPVVIGTDEELDMRTPTGKNRIDPENCFLASRGRDNARAYFEQNSCNKSNPYPTSRGASGGRHGNNIQRPRAFVDEIGELESECVRKHMSTDESEMVKLGAKTKKFLQPEYQWVVAHHPGQKKHIRKKWPNLNKEWDRDVLLDKVLRGRREIAKMKPAIMQRREKLLRKKFKEDHPVPKQDKAFKKRVDKEAELRFYAGTETSQTHNSGEVKVNVSEFFYFDDVGDDDGECQQTDRVHGDDGEGPLTQISTDSYAGAWQFTSPSVNESTTSPVRKKR